MLVSTILATGFQCHKPPSFQPTCKVSPTYLSLLTLSGTRSFHPLDLRHLRETTSRTQTTFFCSAIISQIFLHTHLTRAVPHLNNPSSAPTSRLSHALTPGVPVIQRLPTSNPHLLIDVKAVLPSLHLVASVHQHLIYTHHHRQLYKLTRHRLGCGHCTFVQIKIKIQNHAKELYEAANLLLLGY